MIGTSGNTSRSALIRCGIFAVALCAAALLVSTVALAADGWVTWETRKLLTTMYDSPAMDYQIIDPIAYIEVTASYLAVGDHFFYEYKLKNTNALRPDSIPGKPMYETMVSFALTFEDVQDSFRDFQPADWSPPSVFPVNHGNGTEMIWYAKSGEGLAHGDSITFGFRTTRVPGNSHDNITSSMGVRGYSGSTYGPGPQNEGNPPHVPELPSVFLGLPGLAFVQVIRTRLAGRIRRRAR